MQIPHKNNNNKAGWCRGSTTGFESVDHRSTRCPATKLRRGASGAAAALLLVLSLLPVFSPPARAYDAQQFDTWFITGEIEYDGEDCWIIGPNPDGALYYTDVSTYFYYDSDKKVSVVLPSANSSGTSVGVGTVVLQSTLQYPRTGFTVDEDWYFHVKVASSELEDNINPSVLRIAFVDKGAWPMSYTIGSNGSSGGYINDSASLAAFPLYFKGTTEYSNLGFSFSANSDYVLKVDSLQLYVPKNVLYQSSSSTGAYPSATLLSAQSVADGNSADIIPIVFPYIETSGFYSKYLNTWVTSTVSVCYEYYCPKSKLGDFAIGDEFPRSADLDIDAILSAIDNAETKYIQQVENEFGVTTGSITNYKNTMQGIFNGIDGVYDSTQFSSISQEMGTSLFENLSIIVEILLMFSCFGLIFLFVRKAVNN